MVKIAQLAPRQRWRTGLLLLSLFLFPLTLFYLSPYIIAAGAAEGVVTGSMLVFGLLFVSSLFVGRLWCGWACPGGAVQEFAIPVRNQLFGPRWLRWGKWVVWIPWMTLIIWLAIRVGGLRRVDLFYSLEGGLTVEQPYWYFVYYIVLALFIGLALAFGRRGGCHTICWMAPFMILGRKLSNLLRTPALRLGAETEKCINCERCTAACPMSLDVNGMVQARAMEHSDCTLCGACADVCPKDVIAYSLRANQEGPR
jgi:ferredoxin-type protein NapH